MDIARIDYWATSGTSTVHKATAYSKVAASALVVATVVVSRDLYVLVTLYALVLVTVRAAGLPLKKVLAISLYPGLFAVLFALSQAGQGWALPAVIIMKALTAATAMLLLVSTTPYADVVGLFGRFLPRVVADGLFMTYRSFFILIKMLDNFLDALKLRGGYSPRRLVRNAGNMASGVGMLFIRAYDLSQRLYDVMSVRGYSGKLSGGRPSGSFHAVELPYPASAAALLIYAEYASRAGLASDWRVLASVLLAYITGMEAIRVWKR